jgi:hypothetical protein
VLDINPEHSRRLIKQGYDETMEIMSAREGTTPHTASRKTQN